MFAAIAHRYDLANHLLSAGLDFWWRRRAAAIIRKWKPRRILDLATGSGDLAVTLGHACPEALVVGADFCLPMLQVARRKGVNNLIVADALQLPFSAETFDVLTVAFGLRNMASWEGALAEMRRVLRPGGHLLILDFSVPKPPLRWVYRPYLHYLLPQVAGWLTGEKGAYEYLGQSIEQFPHGPAMCALLERIGFSEAGHEPLSGGIVSLYTAARSSNGPSPSFPGN
jgi:demethylmenaquinone methyltransferase/2-methoxy-6-polyprenyl-1,4-benzoquinol methylase